MPLSNGQYSDRRVLNRFLDTNGDGTGIKNANGNYSVTPSTFFIKPGIDEVFVLSELIICFTGAGNFKGSDYGTISGGLLVGVNILAKRNGVLRHDVTDGVPIKTNSGYGCLSGTFGIEPFSAGAETMVHVTVNSTEYDSHFILYGNQNDTLEISLNDNFTSLLSQHFKVNGYW